METASLGKSRSARRASLLRTLLDKGWLPAVVPGTVLTSLVKNGVYPEPLYGENDRLIPEKLAHDSYWYRATFPIATRAPGRRDWLEFDIFAEAGGAGKLLVKDFEADSLDPRGNIVLAFTRGSANEP